MIADKQIVSTFELTFLIDVFRDELSQIEVEFLDATGEPLDLTDWNVYFIALHKENRDIFLEKEVLMTEPSQGKGMLVLTQQDTAVAGIYDAEFDARRGNEVVTLIQGKLIVRKDVQP